MKKNDKTGKIKSAISSRKKRGQKVSFTDLEVWQEAHKLNIEIYETTMSFPDKERYRLVDQLCRDFSSVTANIAEGSGRRTLDEYIHFISNSRGSVEEMKNHLIF